MAIAVRILLLTPAVLSLLAAAENLPDVLARMDRAAKEFKTFSASAKRVQYTNVLKETEESKGSVRLRKSGSGTGGIMEFGAPDERTLHIAGHTLEIFYPKGPSVEIYDLGKGANKAEQWLLLGFGTAAADIRKSYDVKLAGSEQVAGVATTRLELNPKEPELKKHVAKIELWIPEGQANPIQEKVTYTSKDYLEVTYSDVKLNTPLPDSAFELKLPPNVKKLYPQK
jgi:outer membrane lipoprotein-sorting protein